MFNETTLRRVLRRIWRLLPNKMIARLPNWTVLAYYPVIVPSDELLKKWNYSRWEEYQKWLLLHSIQNSLEWSELHQQHLQWIDPPKISIVTPVFNTEPRILYECILSVRMQTYPYWQWILVDDASTRADTKSLLASGVVGDPRIEVIFAKSSLGISNATNTAIERAAGDYVVFLDHDDRLSLDALGLIVQEISRDRSIDILYSDRDMLSEDNDRYLHLFKPDWSPESLLAGNYIFHLMCYRRELLEHLHGLQAEYDGSQDYDLILRAAELQPKVQHIARILYHWRQHAASVALNVNAKDYAFNMGVKALNAALKRRKISGVAKEIPNFWRGTFQIEGLSIESDMLQLIRIKSEDALNYSSLVSQAINVSTCPYIAILGANIEPENTRMLHELAGWLNMEQVGLVTGKILNGHGLLDYVGMAYQKNGCLIYPYRGFSETEPGYMGVVQLVRNISVPHPYCVIIRRSVWQALNGFNQDFKSPFALLDFALRALQLNWRSVLVPQCRFNNRDEFFNAEMYVEDHIYFQGIWQDWLNQGDPYYNVNLAETSKDMGINI